MSISLTGTIGSRSGGLVSAIAKEARKASLKPIKRIVFQFDPFLKESKETRDFLFHLERKSIVKTNPACLFKTSVVCDRSEPTVTFNLVNGSSVLFKAKHLSALDMFQLFNKHITSLVPKEEPVAVIKTKSEKKAARRK